MLNLRRDRATLDYGERQRPGPTPQIQIVAISQLPSERIEDSNRLY